MGKIESGLKKVHFYKLLFPYTVEPWFMIWWGGSKIILLNRDIIVNKLPA